MKMAQNRKPKILYNCYPTSFQRPGGGQTQLLKTREYIQKNDIQVDLFNQFESKIVDYDIIHQFSANIDAQEFCKYVKKINKKFCVSSIYWEDKKYDRKEYGLLSYLKYLSIFIDKRFKTSIYKPGKILRLADIILPNSQVEAELLNKNFNIPFNKIVVIPNAVDRSFTQFDKTLYYEKSGLTDYILCVGRIEPRKNQLSLIKAVSRTDLHLVIMGEVVEGEEQYYDECIKASNDKVHFIGKFPHGSDIQKSIYANAKIFALPSWYETPGLAALEAAIMGVKIVITENGCTKEYFKEFAEYANPSSVEDIYNKIIISINKKHNPEEQIKYITENYTWEATANKTIEAYRRLK